LAPGDVIGPSDPSGENVRLHPLSHFDGNVDENWIDIITYYALSILKSDCVYQIKSWKLQTGLQHFFTWNKLLVPFAKFSCYLFHHTLMTIISQIAKKSHCKLSKRVLQFF